MSHWEAGEGGNNLDTLAGADSTCATTDTMVYIESMYGYLQLGDAFHTRTP